MQDLDDDGLVNLVKGVVVTAERDAKHGDTDAGDFLAWLRGQQAELDAAYKRIDERLARMNGTTSAASAPQPAQPAPSPFEGLDAARLDALGVSVQWANMSAADLAALERKQAHIDRAGRLGVDPRYLPQQED